MTAFKYVFHYVTDMSKFNSKAILSSNNTTSTCGSVVELHTSENNFGRKLMKNFPQNFFMASGPWYTWSQDLNHSSQFTLKLTEHVQDQIIRRTDKLMFWYLLHTENITYNNILELYDMVIIGCTYAVHLPKSNRRLICKRTLRKVFVMISLTAPTHPDAPPTGFVATKKHPDTKGIVFSGGIFVYEKTKMKRVKK